MYYAAIDPIAVILSGTARRIWYDKNHPHVPKVADVVAVLKSLPPEERTATVDRAKTLAA